MITPEGWAAITAIALPIIAALAANIRLTIAVQSLTKEMHAIRSFFPALERRVAKLEGKLPKKVKNANR